MSQGQRGNGLNWTLALQWTILIVAIISALFGAYIVLIKSDATAGVKMVAFEAVVEEQKGVLKEHLCSASERYDKISERLSNIEKSNARTEEAIKYMNRILEARGIAFGGPMYPNNAKEGSR